MVQDNDSTIWIADDAILLVFFFDRKASRSKLANYIWIKHLDFNTLDTQWVFVHSFQRTCSNAMLQLQSGIRSLPQPFPDLYTMQIIAWRGVLSESQEVKREIVWFHILDREQLEM